MRHCTSFSIRNCQESCNDRSGTKRASGWCPVYKSGVRPTEGCWSRGACARVCGDASFGRTRGAVGRICLASSTGGATRGQTPRTLALGMPQHVQEVQAHRGRARFFKRFTCSFSHDDGGQDSLSWLHRHPREKERHREVPASGCGPCRSAELHSLHARGGVERECKAVRLGVAIDDAIRRGREPH